MLKLSGVENILAMVASGILLGFGVVWPAFGMLSLLGAWLFVYWSFRYLSQYGRKTVFCFGFLSWLVARLISISWFWSVYPIDWLGVSGGWMQLATIFVYWLAASLCLAVGGGVIALFIAHVCTRRLAVMWGLPVVWLASEILGSFVFSIVSWAPGITPNAGFSFGYLGYAAAQYYPFVLMAKWGGVYILSLALMFFVVVLVLAQIHFKKTRMTIVGAACLLLVQVSGVVPPTPLPSVGVSVVVVESRYDTNFLASVSGRNQRAQDMREAVRLANDLHPTYILLPEDTRFSDSFPSTEAAMNWYRFAPETPALLVDTGYTNEAGAQYLRAHIYNPVHDTIDHFDKQYLVPQGEFFPQLFVEIFTLLGGGTVVGDIQARITYAPGPLRASQYPLTSPAIIFCSESVMPYAAIQKSSEHYPPVILHPLSHAWFHEPTLLWNQLDSMLSIQAIWSDRPIVSAGNMAASKVYYSTGNVKRIEVEPQGEYYAIGFVEL